MFCSRVSPGGKVKPTHVESLYQQKCSLYILFFERKCVIIPGKYFLRQFLGHQKKSDALKTSTEMLFLDFIFNRKCFLSLGKECVKLQFLMHQKKLLFEKIGFFDSNLVWRSNFDLSPFPFILEKCFPLKKRILIGQ